MKAENGSRCCAPSRCFTLFHASQIDGIYNYVPPASRLPFASRLVDVKIHEMSHWSGAQSRLHRDMSGRFGSKSYAREDLVAELARTMVCSTLGIEDCDFINGAAYLAHWLSILREDKKEIFRVAADAKRAADYLLASHPEYASQLQHQKGSEDPVATEPEIPLKIAA